MQSRPCFLFTLTTLLTLLSSSLSTYLYSATVQPVQPV